jgi:hypothetical protein
MTDVVGAAFSAICQANRQMTDGCIKELSQGKAVPFDEVKELCTSINDALQTFALKVYGNSDGPPN